MTPGWSTPEDIAARVRRRWDDGSLLRTFAAGAPWEPIVVVLRGPKPAQIGDDIGAVRDWVTALDTGRRSDTRYGLEWKSVGGRQIGRNQLPHRAVVSSYQQAWALLGTQSVVNRFGELLTLVQQHPPLHAWAVAAPHRVLALQPEMARLIAAYEWLDTHRDSRKYLREISAPGVDTKFAERYRSDLADMLGVSRTSFLDDLGLRTKPAMVRVRFGPTLGLPAPLTEIAARADELAALPLRPRTAVIVENEISYLSASVPEDGVVLWGKGFEVDQVGRMPWLSDVVVAYWGDIDTHGFAILDRLRAWLPTTRSVLMDRETLLAHQDRWVTEDRPARSALTRLTPSELALYTDVVEDRLAERVRLEQERIDWRWVEDRLMCVY
ncbi:Wadjet anti-phage system protein JetD domain-containing protein [Mycobacterium sp. C31M]